MIRASSPRKSTTKRSKRFSMECNIMRIRLITLVTVLVGTFFSALVQAQAASDFTTTTNNGQVTITKYTGPGGDVDIPGIINGLPVTSIGANSFQKRVGLTSVIIPEGVTSIEKYAFDGCDGL